MKAKQARKLALKHSDPTTLPKMKAEIKTLASMGFTNLSFFVSPKKANEIAAFFENLGYRTFIDREHHKPDALLDIEW